MFALWKIEAGESIFGDKFATGSRINVLTAHAHCADIIVTKVAENGVVRPKCPNLYRKTGALNSNSLNRK